MDGYRLTTLDWKRFSVVFVAQCSQKVLLGPQTTQEHVPNQIITMSANEAITGRSGPEPYSFGIQQSRSRLTNNNFETTSTLFVNKQPGTNKTTFNCGCFILNLISFDFQGRNLIEFHPQRVFVCITVLALTLTAPNKGVITKV